MERIQAVALAILIAVGALFGLSYLLEGASGGGSPGDVYASGLGPDGRPRRGTGVWNSDRESRRAGVPPPPGDDPRGRGRRAGGGGIESRDTADLVPGTSRSGRSSGAGGGASIDAADLIARVSDDLLAARTGAVPRAGAPAGSDGGAGPGRHVFEFVDEPRDDPRGGGDVLLSIPFKGDVEADKGGDPLYVDGLIISGSSVEFTENAQLTFPSGGHVQGKAGTISFEIEPRWAGSDETNNSLLLIHTEHQWENNLSLVKNFDSLRFIIIDDRGVESNVNVSIHDWVPNQSRQVTATWGDELMALYVDGQLVGERSLPNRLAFDDTTPIHIGSDFPDSQYRGAQGTISDLKLYGRALRADEIR